MARLEFEPDEFPARVGDALMLIAATAVVGVLTGLLAVAFLTGLHAGTAWRLGKMAEWREAAPILGIFLTVGGVAASAALGAWAVRRFAPKAAGSGVPYVEHILRGGGEPDHRHVLPVKFFGGLLALSSGLVLGREGPLVQMGAVIGERLGRRLKNIRGAWKALMTCGAGAGLASAFNAPVGGTIFILEEVQRRVTPLSFLLAATAATTGVFVQRAVFHLAPEYRTVAATTASAEAVPVFLAFGCLVGLLGVLYNRLLLAFLSWSRQLASIPIELRAAAIGATIGLIGWFEPDLTGGGDELIAAVFSGGVTAFLLIGAVRFFLGPLSYTAGTPGGLFAPIITIGALCGAAFGHWQHDAWPVGAEPAAFAVAGMAAFFTATVRAPLTGIVICLEMTGAYGVFFPLLATCLGAYLVPTLLRNEPIYDALARFSHPEAYQTTSKKA